MAEKIGVPFGLRSIVLAQIIDLAKTYKLHKIILFGSRARGDYKKASDIDLAVTGGDIVRFTLDVDENTDTLLQYDVVNLDSSIQPELLESIYQEGVIIYEKI